MRSEPPVSGLGRSTRGIVAHDVTDRTDWGCTEWWITAIRPNNRHQNRIGLNQLQNRLSYVILIGALQELLKAKRVLTVHVDLNYFVSYFIGVHASWRNKIFRRGHAPISCRKFWSFFGLVSFQHLEICSLSSAIRRAQNTWPWMTLSSHFIVILFSRHYVFTPTYLPSETMGEKMMVREREKMYGCNIASISCDSTAFLTCILRFASGSHRKY